MFLETLSTRCHHLRLLNISKNIVEDDGISVMSALAKLASLYEEEPTSDRLGLTYMLNELNIGDTGLYTFVKNIGSLSSSYCCFAAIELQGNNIRAVGVSHLVRAKNISINSLFLDDNPIGIQGAQAIGEMLSSNKFSQLHTLRLSRCQLTNLSSADSVSLDQSMMVNVVDQKLRQLSRNHTIEVLHLDGNSFTGHNINILAGFICLCSRLSTLSSCECGITVNDLKQLFSDLSQCEFSSDHWHSWYLGNNEASTNDAYHAMDEHLPSLLSSKLLVFTEVTSRKVRDKV